MKKLLDFKKLILRLWFILWAILILLLIMKFCFGIWYPIVVDNQTFINICGWLDEHNLVKRILYYTIYVINGFLMILIFTKTKYFKHWWTYLIIVLFLVGMVIAKDKINALGIVFELLIVVLSTIYNVKNKQPFTKTIFNILYATTIYLIINLFQLNILLVRGLSIDLLQKLPTLLTLVLQLDYYIFLIITYIGVCVMGILGFGWLWGKSLTDLEEIREKELAKKQPDLKLLEEVDKAIAEKEKEV